MFLSLHLLIFLLPLIIMFSYGEGKDMNLIVCEDTEMGYKQKWWGCTSTAFISLWIPSFWLNCCMCQQQSKCDSIHPLPFHMDNWIGTHQLFHPLSLLLQIPPGQPPHSHQCLTWSVSMWHHNKQSNVSTFLCHFVDLVRRCGDHEGVVGCQHYFYRAAYRT